MVVKLFLVVSSLKIIYLGFNFLLRKDNGGPRPYIFEIELTLSDICWKEKNRFSQFKSVVTVINIVVAQGKF